MGKIFVRLRPALDLKLLFDALGVLAAVRLRLGVMEIAFSETFGIKRAKI